MEIREQDKMLLRFLFSEAPYSAEELSFLLEGLDIDQEQSEYLLLLAHLGMRFQWKFFPEKIRPRLEGIYRAARLRNIYGIPWLKAQIDALHTAEIPVMFLKGMAMRTYYAPGTARQMSDYDLAVPKERFDEAKALLLDRDPSNCLTEVLPHAVTIVNNNRKVDLHRRIFAWNDSFVEPLWDAGFTIDFQGTSVYLLDPTDMIIHLLDSKARDTILNVHQDRRLMWLFDVRSILDEPSRVDWAATASRGKETGSSYYLKMLLPVLSEVFPEILSKQDLAMYFTKDPQDLVREKQIGKYKEVLAGYYDYALHHNKSKKSIAYRCRTLRHAWAKYKYYLKPEFESRNERLTFVQFLCRLYQADSLPALLLRDFR